MAEPTQIDRDEETYWHLARAFVRVLMVEANDALKECGVEDPQLRQRIASQFGFGLGNFFDQCWLEANGQRYYPLLCFTERFPGAAGSAAELGTIRGPVPEVELHAMADDEAHWFYTEQKEDEASVPMGLQGDADDAEPGAAADGGA